MTEMTERVARALEQAFKDRVATTAGQPFESTGATAPGFDVWEAYARAAVGAMTPAEVRGSAEIADLTELVIEE